MFYGIIAGSMSLRRYLSIMALTTVVCWLAFITVLFRVDPYSGGAIGFTLFYVALFFAVWGTLSLLGFFMRFLFKRHDVPYRHVGISLRQAFWFSTLIVLSLILVADELFVWWMVALLILGFTILEGFFLARSLEARRQQQRHRES